MQQLVDLLALRLPPLAQRESHQRAVDVGVAFAYVRAPSRPLRGYLSLRPRSLQVVSVGKYDWATSSPMSYLASDLTMVQSMTGSPLSPSTTISGFPCRRRHTLVHFLRSTVPTPGHKVVLAHVLIVLNTRFSVSTLLVHC